jgi:ureidoacrylate peracid hydrolase
MNDRLDPRTTALLLFDLLNVHVKKNGETLERYLPVVANVKRLQDAARERGVLVAYAMASHRADGATSALLHTDTDTQLRPWGPDGPHARPVVAGGTPEAQVIDELAPLPDEYLVPKYRWSAFRQTYLELALRRRGITTIVLVGGTTEIGIASTAFAARDLDFDLVIVSDACSSPFPNDQDHLMRRVFPRLSRVRTTAQVLAMLG